MAESATAWVTEVTADDLEDGRCRIVLQGWQRQRIPVYALLYRNRYGDARTERARFSGRRCSSTQQEL